MMKYFLLFAFGILLAACDGSNSVQQVKTGNVDKLDRIIDDDILNHSRGGQVGLDNLKLLINGIHLNMKNPKMEVIRKMANNDYVSNSVRFIGGNPTVVIESIEVTRYYDGLAKRTLVFSKLAG